MKHNIAGGNGPVNTVWVYNTKFKITSELTLYAVNNIPY